MANIDEELLGKRELGSKKEEEQAGHKMNQDKTEKRTGTSISGKNRGSNLNKMKSPLRAPKSGLTQKGRMGGAKMGIGGKITGGAGRWTDGLLRKSWISFATVFGGILGFLYINIHVFCHMTVSKKIFCKLGEEWFPPPTRTLPGVQAKIKKANLVEKGALALVDAIVGFVLLIIVCIIGLMVKVITNPLDFIAELLGIK